MVSGGTINEVIDIRFNSQIKEMFEDIFSNDNNETMTIRFVGESKYFNSYMFSKGYRKFTPVFDAHKMLKERYSK